MSGTYYTPPLRNSYNLELLMIEGIKDPIERFY